MCVSPFTHGQATSEMHEWVVTQYNARGLKMTVGKVGIEAEKRLRATFNMTIGITVTKSILSAYLNSSIADTRSYA